MIKEDREVISFEIEGEGFLHNMVRIIIGTVVQIGLGKIEAEEIPKIFEAKNRQQAGPGAPAKGLTLVSITY